MNIIGVPSNPFKRGGPTDTNEGFKKDGEGSEEDFPSLEEVVEGSSFIQLELGLGLLE